VITRTVTRLADGRELIYFDDEDGHDRSTPDERDLPAADASSQIRWDPLFGEWAVIAGHRQSRTYRPPSDECPLCPSHAGRHTEIPAADYHVAVFENRFPSLGPPEVATLSTAPPFVAEPGVGRCEVVCFTSDHTASFAQLSRLRARTVIDALAERTEALSALDGVEYVFCFENRGEEIGVTLAHPHGQIYGYPFLPPRMASELRMVAAHEHDTGQCLHCHLLLVEERAAERVVAGSPHWLAYVPFAARWPYEVRVVARRHVPDLPALTDDERDDLAEIYLTVLRCFDGLFAGAKTPYIAGWRQAPVRIGRDGWHLAAEIFTIRRAASKLKYLAGSESGAGVWINDVLPEVAAARLRGGALDQGR
jgi:UDPglucose--hexose-1-phosphate uridylyltransferase